MPPTSKTEDRLKLFVAKVDEIRKRRVLKNGFPKIGLRVAVTGGDGPVVLDVPDEEDYRSFMLDFRRFAMSREPVQFTSIANILHQRLTDPDLTKANSQNRANWKEIFRGNFELVHDDRRYTASELYDLVVNGQMFHDDAAKAATFNALPKPFKALAKYTVYEIGLGGARVLIMQSNLIRKALDTNSVRLNGAP